MLLGTCVPIFPLLEEVEPKIPKVPDYIRNGVTPVSYKKHCSAISFIYNYARPTELKLIVILTRDFMEDVFENHAF